MYSGYQPAELDGLPDAQPSSTTLEQVVLTATQTTLTSSPSPSMVGDAVTFSVTVFADGVAADGDVTFIDGSTPLGTVAVDANGEASLTTTGLTAGVHTISARYNGADGLAPSSDEITQRVDAPPAPSTTTSTALTSTTTTSTTAPTSTTLPGQSETVTELSSSRNPSAAGERVTFTATVTTVGSGAGGPSGFRAAVTPRQVDGGTLTISAGGTILAVVPVEGGQASFSTSALSPGAHTIIAAFSGTAFAAPSNASIVQQVDEPPTTTTSPPTSPPATLPPTR